MKSYVMWDFFDSAGISKSWKAYNSQFIISLNTSNKTVDILHHVTYQGKPTVYDKIIGTILF